MTIGRAELLAILARVKPVRVALLADDAPLEWLAVPRGTKRWERLIDRTIGDRAWSELRLCDARSSTIEVVTAAPTEAPAADDLAAAELGAAAATGDPTARFAALLANVVTTTVKTVTESLQDTVRTMRTESRAEQTELLAAHQAMARDAFELRAQESALLAVERDRRLAAEAELAELRAQLGAQTAPDPGEQREGRLLSLLTGGATDPKPDATPRLPSVAESQGMPTG